MNIKPGNMLGKSEQKSRTKQINIHWGMVTGVCVREYDYLWFLSLFVACSRKDSSWPIAGLLVMTSLWEQTSVDFQWNIMTLPYPLNIYIEMIHWLIDNWND